MARLIKRLHTEITIERRSFDLLDDGGPQDVVPSFEDGGHWLFTGRNSITVVTQDSEADFATIAVELWDTEPPPAEGFDETDSSTITLDSGLLEVNPLVEDSSSSGQSGRDSRRDEQYDATGARLGRRRRAYMTFAQCWIGSPSFPLQCSR
jgi:hypothetical protein